MVLHVVLLLLVLLLLVLLLLVLVGLLVRALRREGLVIKEISPATGVARPYGNLDPEGALTLVKGLAMDVVDVVYEAFDSAAREVEEQCVGVLKTLQHSLLKL